MASWPFISRELCALAVMGCLSSCAVQGQTAGAAGSSVVTGQVTDELSGAPLRATISPVAGLGLETVTATADDIGRYELSVSPAVMAITAHFPGYLPETRSIVATPDQTVGRVAELDFLLRSSEGLFQPTDPTCDVAGGARDQSTARALVGVQVSVEGARPRIASRTQLDGSFVLPAVPAGLHLLRAEAVGFHREARLVLIRCADGSPVPPVTFLKRELTLVLD